MAAETTIEKIKTAKLTIGANNNSSHCQTITETKVAAAGEGKPLK